MKKIILVVVLVAALAVILAGCNSSAAPSSAWADEETLEYNVLDTNSRENLGTMKVVTVRNPADKTLDGAEYNADGKVTIDIVTTRQIVHIEMLTARYTVLATHKDYTDLTDAAGSYVLKAHHSGKNYFYTLNGGEEKKLKVGSTGYVDSEYIYHYIRCYPLNSPPSSIKVADPINHTVNTVACSAYASTKTAVPYPDGTKEAECTVVAISLSSAPVGKSISVAFTPDSTDFHMSGLSISPSKKMPVLIEENDVTYVISSMHVK